MRHSGRWRSGRLATDERGTSHGHTRARKRRGGPMRTSVPRRCAPAGSRKLLRANALRLRTPSGQCCSGCSGVAGSDPPVRGPGTGSEAGVFAHPCPRPLGVAPDPSIPTREGGLSAASRRRITRSPAGRPSGSRASPSKAGVPPMARATAQAAKSGTRPSQVTDGLPELASREASGSAGQGLGPAFGSSPSWAEQAAQRP